MPCDKHNDKHNDALYAENYLPLFPATGISFARSGAGKIWDNHGNILSKNELKIKNEDGSYTTFHLSHEQEDILYDDKIGPHQVYSNGSIQLKNEIKLFPCSLSPLEVMGNELGNLKAPEKNISTPNLKQKSDYQSK